MKREIYTEEHDIFRDAFRKFLEKEVARIVVNRWMSLTVPATPAASG